MINRDIFDRICCEYGFHIHDYIICEMDQYPHIDIVTCEENQLIIKQVPYRKDISFDTLYSIITTCPAVLSPIIDMHHRYCYHENSSTYILYEYFFQKESAKPPAEWYATTMYDLHNTKLPSDIRRNIRRIHVTDAKEWLTDVSYRMDPWVYNELAWMLQQGCATPSDQDLVLCHSDVSQNNVLMVDGKYYMIDTNNCALSAREFDIQHLIWNRFLICDDFTDIESFYRELLLYYSAAAKIILNKDLLITLYANDFVKSISWLTTVVLNKERADHTRQLNELDCFHQKMSLGYHRNLLKMIRRL